MPGQVLMNAELCLYGSGVIHKTDAETNVDLLTERLRDVRVHNADATATACATYL